MSAANTKQLKAEFAELDLMLIKEFANLLLPLPTGGHKVFKIQTADGFVFYVWGENAEDVLTRLHRFLGLRAFI